MVIFAEKTWAEWHENAPVSFIQNAAQAKTQENENEKNAFMHSHVRYHADCLPTGRQADGRDKGG